MSTREIAGQVHIVRAHRQVGGQCIPGVVGLGGSQRLGFDDIVLYALSKEKAVGDNGVRSMHPSNASCSTIFARSFPSLTCGSALEPRGPPPQ